MKGLVECTCHVVMIMNSRRIFLRARLIERIMRNLAGLVRDNTHTRRRFY